jgi:hypothetical protein
MSARVEALMLKRYVFIFLLSLFVVSCAAPQEKPITPLPSTPSSVTAIPTLIPFTSTPKKFVPKQNDLIFIEFFAVT